MTQTRCTMLQARKRYTSVSLRRQCSPRRPHRPAHQYRQVSWQPTRHTSTRRTSRAAQYTPPCILHPTLPHSGRAHQSLQEWSPQPPPPRQQQHTRQTIGIALPIRSCPSRLVVQLPLLQSTSRSTLPNIMCRDSARSALATTSSCIPWAKESSAKSSSAYTSIGGVKKSR